MAVRLYPVVKVQGLDFSDVKRIVIPKQSLSLAEIVRRFVRREALPVFREGYYEHRFGDLEKLSKSDIVTQLERAEELRGQIDGFNKREAARAEAAKNMAQTEPVKEG